MSIIELARLKESCVKGHHVYRSQFIIGAIFNCEHEASNTHSTWAIVVKKPTGEVVGHIPDSLAEVLLPLLTSGEVEGIKCEITGLSRGAAGGVWVQGGGLVIPCTYILLGKKLNKPTIRSKLKRRARKRSQADKTTEPGMAVKRSKTDSQL